MAIDNPFDAIHQQYAKDEPNIPAVVSTVAGTALAIGAVAGIPHLAIPVFLASSWKKFTDRTTWKERTDATLQLVVERLLALEPEYKRLDDENERLNVRLEDLSSAICVGIANDGTTSDDTRRDRFVTAVSNATITSARIDDLVSFVQDLDRLNDTDIAALKVLNRVMNKRGDWGNVTENSEGLHPNTFLQRQHELAVQMAEALGKADKLNGDRFSREAGLGLCLRLQGFGLAEVLTSQTRSVPRTNYCARPTPRGFMLLRLLGEAVENWERYFDAEGPL